MRASVRILTTAFCAASLSSPAIAQMPVLSAPNSISAPAPIAQNAPIAPPPGVASSATKPAERRILNGTTAQIEYRIDTVGPSGIGRVDIHITRDGGQTWEKLGEDTNKRSPVSINLPGEGVYGVRLAITNGNGFGGRAPRSGDRPQFVVEVDATSPQVDYHPCQVVDGAVVFRWTATDANLGPEPVSLFFRSHLEQPWQPIARNVKNDGAYRWPLPQNIGAQIFVKLEVADLAGNVTKVENPMPILLDQTEPEASLIDVIGVANRGASPRSTPPAMPPSLPLSSMPPSMPPSTPTPSMLPTPPVTQLR